MPLRDRHISPARRKNPFHRLKSFPNKLALPPTIPPDPSRMPRRRLPTARAFTGPQAAWSLKPHPPIPSPSPSAYAT
jgi:hypothetical protein